VTTSPAVPALITIDGEPANDWGLAWLDLRPGDYTVCVEPVLGFVAELECDDLTVAVDQTTAIEFAFEAERYLRVMTSPAQEATVSVAGVPRNDWGMWMPWSEQWGATVEVCVGPSRTSGVPPSPACQIANRPGPGQTATVTGSWP